MDLEKKVIIVLVAILAIVLYILLGGYAREDSFKRDIDSLQSREKQALFVADQRAREADKQKDSASHYRALYDSLTVVSTKATAKADKLAKQYEDLLHHPIRFASDAQRDSLLRLLYPR